MNTLKRGINKKAEIEEMQKLNIIGQKIIKMNAETVSTRQ